MRHRRKIIIVTDGDRIAQKAVEKAASNIGGRCISRSAGNPTPLSCEEVIALVKQCPNDPVVIMVDDVGKPGIGKGEELIKQLAERDEIEILGVVAVASNTREAEGIEVDCSVNNVLDVTGNPVDKEGNTTDDRVIYGDTVDVLNHIDVPVIVGIGDPGKMNGRDDFSIGCPVITKALQLVIDRSDIG